MTAGPAKHRAIGIVRVSQRDDESGHSPEVQVRAMLKQAAGEDFTLDPADIWDENVDTRGVVRPASGGAQLADRPKLRAAVEAVERGDAGVIVAERFDRLFRDLDVQRAVIRRVEAAGGRVVTAAGMISHATAEAELHANLNGSISQYQKRTAMERSFDAVEVAIEQARVPWKSTTPGYDVGEAGRLVPNAHAPVVEDAFRLRAGRVTVRRVREFAREHGIEGRATVAQVREFLREHGIERSHHGTTGLLASRVVLGEIHFGKHTPNLTAHPAIVDRDLWKAVQDVKITRGRKAKSERLLARLGVLLCAECGSRMVVGSSNHSRYWVYRCPPTGDCARRPTISAEMVEGVVVDDVRRLLAGVRGTARSGDRAVDTAAALDRAQAAYDAAMRVLDPLEPAAVDRLGQLRADRDAARQEHDAAMATAGVEAIVVTAGDWDDLTLDERRALVRATIGRVEVVAGGRGRERISVTPRTVAAVASAA